MEFVLQRQSGEADKRDRRREIEEMKSGLTVEVQCATVPAECLVDSIPHIQTIAGAAREQRTCRCRPTPEHEASAGALPPLDAAAAAPLAWVKVLTWNVWFDTTMEFDLRLQSLVSQLLAAAPCVAGLQEVTPRFAAALRGSTVVTALYAVSPNRIEGYGTLMLVRNDVQVQWHEHELPSNMDRRLLIAECLPLSDACGTFAVATVHLESLNAAAMRRRQLKVCEEKLRRWPAACLCGDFNFDSSQQW